MSRIPWFQYQRTAQVLGPLPAPRMDSWFFQPPMPLFPKKRQYLDIARPSFVPLPDFDWHVQHPTPNSVRSHKPRPHGWFAWHTTTPTPALPPLGWWPVLPNQRFRALRLPPAVLGPASVAVEPIVLPVPWGWFTPYPMPVVPAEIRASMVSGIVSPVRGIVWADFGTPWLYSASNWDPTYVFVPEVYARVIVGSAVYVRLTEDTIPLPATQFSVTQTSFTRVRGAVFAPVNGKEYRIQFGHDLSGSGEAYGAWIVAYVPP